MLEHISSLSLYFWYTIKFVNIDIASAPDNKQKQVDKRAIIIYI